MSPIVFKKGDLVRPTEKGVYSAKAGLFLCLENITRSYGHAWGRMLRMADGRFEIGRFYLGDVVSGWGKVVGKR